MSEEENKEDEKPEEKTEEGGGGKKLLIVGLLAGLIVGGGGAAGYFIMQSGNDGGAEVVEAEPEPEIERPDYQYAQLDRLSLPLFHNGRVLNYAMMSVSLETIGEENMTLVNKNMIIIKDALLRHYSNNSVGREDNPRVVDFDKLSSKIQEIIDQEIGKNIVTRVVINDAMNL
ncbi:flagellar basal body-associated FliL family protein [Pseudemcibacter aquimaris]|uniref:flagellar basal body-associated FliL family protein n=1 Tax=Pseudemcibacter aquimaris TaxID=2857064 RepID=UPI00201135A0|nr:hypothetical protein [Pseudemcibacter aquimaris]MCC3860609.1 hypothetical protein [Pseudemcibacter aquimaris]WDU59429.1 hypothetical protein KW060_04035 [Pseudemcibacter aquimaris]